MKRVFTAADVGAIIVVVIWGSSYPLIKSVYDEVSPLAFTQLRFIIAALILLPFVIRNIGVRDMPAGIWVRTAIIGLFTVTVYQICFSVGLLYTTASNSSLIVGSAPVFTLLYVYVTRTEVVRPVKAAGIFVALCGLIVLIASGGGVTLAPAGYRGDLITVGSAVAYGFAAAISKPVMEQYPATFIMGVGMVIGTVALLPVGLPALLAQNWTGLTTGVWWKLAYSSILAAAVSYVVWFWCIGRIGPTKTAAFGYFIPVTAIVMSALMLNERMPIVGIAGAVIVFGGVSLTRWGDLLWSRGGVNGCAVDGEKTIPAANPDQL